MPCKALSDFMDECGTRADLWRALTPAYREVSLSKCDSAETLTADIKMVLSLWRNAFQQQSQPVLITFKVLNEKCNVSPLKYPVFGEEGVKDAPAHRISTLTSMLRCVMTKMVHEEVCTVRDVYYQNVELYGRQRVVSDWLKVFQSVFQVSNRDVFCIVAAQKGLCFLPQDLSCGNLTLKASHSNLIPYLVENTAMTSDWSRIGRVIVLEKDSVFNRIIKSPEISNQTLIVTGKGYPDLLTRRFLSCLARACSDHVTFEIYTDSDPYGIDIALKYMESESEDVANVRRLVYRGVFITDLINGTGNFSESLQLLPMSPRDFRYATILLSKLNTKALLESQATPLKRELQRQLFFLRKAEMNVVPEASFAYYFQRKKYLGRAGN
ncbi:LAMI_0E01552g1_1 [Lachancea mirantina]|uniref:DNA topoisomerase (ATP-hydrolyzing) n=1 Tax=Lachancea mirantina TaxID=1230905 RepID=A0A1G4JJG3_9SACH|nr:LAMI_0E01552g1_1 [Lachancea mirantina]